MQAQALVKKAFQIDLEKVVEGYLYSPIICHAENVNKAKSLLLKQIQHEEIQLKFADEVSYLNIPVFRRWMDDIILFEGKEIFRYQLDEIRIYRERREKLNAILNDPQVEYCFIKKRGSYYGPNMCGYYSSALDAGIYTKQEAVCHATGAGEVSIYPVNKAEYNQKLADRIKELKSKILK